MYVTHKERIPLLNKKIWTKNLEQQIPWYTKQMNSPTTTATLADTTSVNEMPTNASEYCIEMLPRQSTNPPSIANATDGPLFCTSS
jgi:hypothetical protein